MTPVFNNFNVPLPRWVREVKHLLPVRSQFVFSGNIRDQFLVQMNDSSKPAILTLENALWETLQPLGFECLVIYDRVDGLRIVANLGNPTNQIVKKIETLLNIKFNDGKFAQTYKNLPNQIRLITEAKGQGALRAAFVIDYASRICSRDGEQSEDEHDFFMACQKFSETATQIPAAQADQASLFNPLIWVVDRLEDMPSWYLMRNERVHAVVVDHPDFDTRNSAARILLQSFSKTTEADNATSDLFANLTDGLSLRSMYAIVRLARSQGIPMTDLPDAIRLYKMGLPGNPWKSEGLRHKIGHASETLGSRVKGQPQAIQKTVDILIRSVEGLTGAYSAVNTSGRPRGVLLFAGPTGVGKTELAKALTETLFGNQHAYIRFDMSEFSEEHADQRLIGAPPGYLGHSAGGELTNAIREKPFSVVLFDEIEKAHPAILDKFLQILEDGRLTDGRGDTAYFSESVLIFTSNLGVISRDDYGNSRLNVLPTDDYEKVSTTIRQGIEDHFKFKLSRPELLNRFGDNIVVFGFISPEIGKQILDGMLINVCTRVQTEKGMTLTLSPESIALLEKYCLTDLSNGGRGIANKLESTFINPLARALFTYVNCPKSLLVRTITYSNVTSSYTVELQ